MASDQEIAIVREYVHDPDQAKFEDEDLERLIDEAGGDLKQAASNGWLIKAGSVAQWYDGSLDGEALSRGQVFDHCKEMAEEYAKQSGASIFNVKLKTRDFEGELDESEFAGP